MNSSLGYWLVAALGVTVGGGAVLDNNLMRRDPTLLVLAFVVVLASFIYLIVDRQISK